jgi:hypothetical protein
MGSRLHGDFGHYRWYANEDRGNAKFSVAVDASAVSATDEERYKVALEAGQRLARAKIFLHGWQLGRAYQVALPPRPQSIPTSIIRVNVLRALYRLYEAGFSDEDICVDIEGVALEFGVQGTLVHRAIDYLMENDLVRSGGTIGRSSQNGFVFITASGVDTVESETLPVETFLRSLYDQVLSGLHEPDRTLGDEFAMLREAASSARSVSELVGFASRVRHFMERCTDALYAEVVAAPQVPTSQTKNKVAGITAAAKSETRRDYVRVLADVIDGHWKRLNNIQAQGAHEGLVEAERLFTYVLLFLSDLLLMRDEARDAAHLGRSAGQT